MDAVLGGLVFRDLLKEQPRAVPVRIIEGRSRVALLLRYADPLAAWDEFLERAGVPEEERNMASALEDPDGRRPRIFFQQVPEGKVAKNKLHLDVRAAPGLKGEERMAALEAECGRLVALGATRVRRAEPEPPMSLGFIVMTDPEGNEFCVL